MSGPKRSHPISVVLELRGEPVSPTDLERNPIFGNLPRFDKPVIAKFLDDLATFKSVQHALDYIGYSLEFQSG
jgi:hypothetical protein